MRNASTIQPQTANVTNAAVETQVQQQIFFLICYTPLARFLGSSDPALIIQRIHYWLQNENAGYLLNNGWKMIFNGYKEWQEQLPWLSIDQIGAIIRHLERIGWIKTEKFYNIKREIGFVGKTPSFHEDNQRKWYRLDYGKIHEDTGVDLIATSSNSPTPTNPPKRLKRLHRANLQNHRMQSVNSQDAFCKIPDSSIYKDHLSIYQIENTAFEKDKAIDITKEDSPNSPRNNTAVNIIDELLDPWIDEPDNAQDSLDVDEQYLESLETIEDSPEDHFSAAPLSEVFTEFETYTITENGNQDYSVSMTSSQGFSKAPKLRTNKEPKETTVSTHSPVQEIWEVIPGRPYPVFLNWRADKHYKPQGGRWESDAYGNAYAEFYKNREKTTVVLFPQFLEYMQRVAQNCNQQLANGIKAILPSCFVTRPDATPENVRQLMENIQELVDRGAQVALPTNYASPASTQSMSFTAATDSEYIPPLPKLEQPALRTSAPLVADDHEADDHEADDHEADAQEAENREILLHSLARNQAKWKNLPKLRPLVEEWVNQTLGVIMTPDGPMLADDDEYSVVKDVEKEEREQGALSKGDNKYGDSTPPEQEPLSRTGGLKPMSRFAPQQESGVISPCKEPNSPCLFVETVSKQPQQVISDNNHNGDSVVNDVETVSKQPQLFKKNAVTPEITKGARVRVYCPGSKRHGKEGIVTRFIYEQGVKKAVVMLENIESKYKQFSCPIPGSDMMQLFLI